MANYNENPQKRKLPTRDKQEYGRGFSFFGNVLTKLMVKDSFRRSFMIGDIKVTTKRDWTIVGLEGRPYDIHLSGLKLNDTYRGSRRIRILTHA